MLALVLVIIVNNRLKFACKHILPKHWQDARYA